MKRFLRIAFIVMLVAAMSAGGVASARPANYPSRPIRIIVPFGAGGITDTIARTFAASLSDKLQTSVVIENLAGGAGAVGMNMLALARPDGYTLILTPSGPAVLTPLHSEVGYTYREFAPIANLSDVPNVLAVRADSGIEDLAGFIDFARNNPGAATVSTSGFGISQHMTMELLAMLLDEPGLITIINFDGGAEARMALMGGQVKASMTSQMDAAPSILDGSFIGIAVTSSQRTEQFPDVPTFLESGFNIDSEVWHGLAAPANTPQEIITFLSDTAGEVMQLPIIKERFGVLGLPITFMPYGPFSERWVAEYRFNSEIVARLRESAQ